MAGSKRELWVPEIGYGDRLRRIRLDLGMGQREFADSIGMLHATYGHHELSTHVRRGAKLVANSIELIYGVPAWWILGLDDPTVITNGYSAPVRSDFALAS